MVLVIVYSSYLDAASDISQMDLDTIYYYGFEYGWGGWWVDCYPNNVWEVVHPDSGCGPGYAYSGENCAATILCGYYPDANCRLISPGPLQLSTIGPQDSLHLLFWHWFRLAGGTWGQTKGWVQIQVFENGNWLPWQTVSLEYFGNSSGWILSDKINLTEYSGERIRIGFYLDGTQYLDWGWYVDGVSIFTKCYVCGDANGDCVISAAALSYLANFLFFGGPEPECFLCG